MKLKRFYALVMTLALALTFTMGAVAQETPQMITHEKDEVVAKAFGEEIKFSDVSFYYYNMAMTYLNQGYDLRAYPETEPLLLREAVSYYIYNVLALHKAGEERNLYPFTEEKIAEISEAIVVEVETSLNQLLESILAGKENPTEEEKADAKKNALLYLTGSEEETEETLIENYVQMVLDSELMNAIGEDLSKSLQLTEEEVKAKFDEMVAQDQENFEGNAYNYEIATLSGSEVYYRPSGFRGISHILLEVDSELMKNYQDLQAQLEEQNNAEEVAAQEGKEKPEGEVTVTQEQIEEAKAEILSSVQATVDEIMAKLEGGATFASLVEEYGKDPGMTTEPYKTEGYATHMDSMTIEQAFVVGAFSEKMQKIGDVSDPVVGTRGVHILEYTKDIPSGAVELTEELKGKITDLVKNEKVKNLYNDEITKIVEGTEIEFLFEIPELNPPTEEEEASQEENKEEAEATEEQPQEEEKKNP